RVVLRVRCEHRLSFADDLFHDGTTDANLAYLALPVTKARHRNLQLRAALVPHHDEAAVCGNGFENQRSDLIESLRERGRSKQRDPHFAYQREKIALPCGMFRSILVGLRARSLYGFEQPRSCPIRRVERDG